MKHRAFITVVLPSAITRVAVLLLGTLLLSLFFLGCNSSTGGGKAHQMPWDTVVYHRLTTLPSGKTIVQDFSIIVPHANSRFEHEINRVVLGIGKNSRTTRQVIDSLTNATRRQLMLDSAWNRELPYSEKVYSTLHYDDEKLTSFVVKSEYLYGTGKKHSNRCYYSFELPDGKAIGEGAIFVDGYESELTTLLLDHLKRKGEEYVYYNLDEVSPNGNFLLDDKGITYCFHKSFVAHDGDYVVDIFLPWEELQGILRKVSPIGHLH